MAPERQLAPYFRSISRDYLSADLAAGHDVRLDLTAIGIRSGSVDVVVAIHVLEHIADDHAALGEVARILAPGGTAVLAVPTVADETVEYQKPNPREHGHVRAPGVDWYRRLEEYFSEVAIWTSTDVPAECQPFVLEDRTRFPNAIAPERPAQQGTHHLDYVAFARL